MAFPREPLPRRVRILWIPLFALALACQTPRSSKSRKGKRTAVAENGAAGSPAASEVTVRRFAPSPETQQQIAKIRDVSWQLFPQSMPVVRLAFFANNLAFVDRDALEAVPVLATGASNPCRSQRVELRAPRELATLADQRLLVVAGDGTFVLDSNCQTREALPKVSYLPGNHLLADPRWPNAFSIFDPATSRFSRFRWAAHDPPSTHFLLPFATLEDANLKDGPCGLMRDGAVACVHGRELITGWPGHRSRSLGLVAEGPAAVRVLPGARVDTVRLLRGEELLEEYFLTKGAPSVTRFPLPRIPFDMVAGPSYLAVMQLTPGNHTQGTEESLVVFESDGTLRWSLPRARVSQNLSEREWVHQYFECRSMATHPTKPWLAVSDCAYVHVYDARNGQLLQRIQRAAP